MNATLHPKNSSLETDAAHHAQVITRWAGGCHIRIDDTTDTILPADAVPDDRDEFLVRFTAGHVVVLHQP